MDQKDRDVIMKEFRSGSSRVLITTDLLVNCLYVDALSMICECVKTHFAWTHTLDQEHIHTHSHTHTHTHTRRVVLMYSKCHWSLTMIYQLIGKIIFIGKSLHY